MVFWKSATTLKQYFVLPKNGSKYYLKYTFLAFPVLGILGLGTPQVIGTLHLWKAVVDPHEIAKWVVGHISVASTMVIDVLGS